MEVAKPREGTTDVELLAKIRAGDVPALGVLYDRYVSMLFPLALRILRDRAEAEDAIHDAFLIIKDRAEQYVPERGPVGAWVVTLVRNLCIDRTRRRDRRAELARQDADAKFQKVLDPETLVSGASARDKVRRALAKLPEAQRDTLLIAYYEGLSYPEIAARDNVPLGTVKSRAARAVAALREALEAEGFKWDEIESESR
jgi:RNA polymerase sigma-70 factor (ECF subfamily)